MAEHVYRDPRSSRPMPQRCVCNCISFFFGCGVFAPPPRSSRFRVGCLYYSIITAACASVNIGIHYLPFENGMLSKHFERSVLWQSERGVCLPFGEDPRRTIITLVGYQTDERYIFLFCLVLTNYISLSLSLLFERTYIYYGIETNQDFWRCMQFWWHN